MLLPKETIKEDLIFGMVSKLKIADVPFMEIIREPVYLSGVSNSMDMAAPFSDNAGFAFLYGLIVKKKLSEIKPIILLSLYANNAIFFIMGLIFSVCGVYHNCIHSVLPLI